MLFIICKIFKFTVFVSVCMLISAHNEHTCMYENLISCYSERFIIFVGSIYI